ncbi:MAG TPA: SusC/RagA family TonB-linked outer membrane protein [Bacteroidales bacterium]|jgi:TonB-linked SusC/RagA family outer membrane protein|nr:SusC/RagA family TonB-linked outer membrane protein [Candidatus Cloacimonadota bacterium]OPZ58131.1 MAG: TonB-dependent Receptor Plug Domain protein [Bacteroidetes bacterium ADurb.BinA012]HPX53069.1 SusC/RagA family TonB-linked outer membrane protein [Bacteroidales bacterium]HQO84553.1 SusC/RagA family TonB-linked outer membrane protein [Bacteroidales bacterium]
MFSAILLILFSGTIISQTLRVSGKVIDNAGLALPGVKIVLEGTITGVASDSDGLYSINAPANGTLVFSFIGMETVKIPIDGRTTINVTMTESSVLVEEVVVTALGIKKEKKALGYSVQDLKSDEILKNKQTNVINSLAAKVAGVSITQSSGSAGAGSTIIIRGGNSASETRDNQPLFVVDGIIYDNSTINSGNSGTDGVTKNATSFSNRVMDINPDDIESMSILKGAAAAALYGSRAADGVVVITTKKGGAGPVRVDFNSKYSYSWVGTKPELQDVYGRGYYNEAGSFSDYTTQSWGNPITGPVYDNVGNFFQGGNVFDNSLSISGGSPNSSFYMSASNFDQTGVVPTTGFDKNTFRFNGEQKYGKLTVGANAAYSITNTLKTLTTAGLYNGGGNGTMTALYGWSRSDDIAKYLNPDGTKYRMFEGIQELASDVENPYWILNKNKLTDKVNRFTGGINVSFNVTDWFNILYRVGYDTYNSGAYTYIAPGGAVTEIYQKGRLSKSGSEYAFLTSNLMLNFNQKVGGIDLNLLLGHTAENTDRVSRTNWGYGFSTPGTISFGNIVDDQKFFTERNVTKRLVGVFGELRASYKSIAYLTVTGRNDWSSTLPVENRSYFYPSVSGSLVFTELLPENDILSFGKIRASWAQVGKDADAYATNTYLWAPQIVSGQFVGTGNSWTGGSPNLVPEIQTSTELGAELRFLEGRLGLDFTWYNSVTKNQLASPRLAQSTGYIFLTLNSGSVQNKGIELSINATPVKKRDFTWDVTLNLSGNRGTLGDFLPGVTFFYVTDVQIGGVKAASVPNGGYFLGLTGDRWLREKDTDGNEIPDGRYIVDESTGLYAPTTVTTNVVGNREPDFIGGLNNNLQYKNLSFSFLIDIRKGGDIYNGTDWYLTTRGLSMKTLDRKSVTVSGVSKTSGEPVTYTYEAGKTYTVGGATKSGEYMIQQYWSKYGDNAYNFITSTNWLRLRSVNLSYDFTDLIGKRGFIKGLSASIGGYNLLLWTNYKGMDPEVSVSGSGTGGSGSMGIDYCGVPATRNVTFGLNATF